MDSHLYYDASAAALVLLDQKALPLREKYLRCTSLDQAIEAIKDLTVRGAPAIGVSAAYAAVLSAREAASKGKDWSAFILAALDRLADARPTAVNLHWAVERMRRVMTEARAQSPVELAAVWLAEADRIREEDIKANKAMGAFGAALIDDGDCILTHCNAGTLATAGFGTALGVIRAAVAQGKRVRVIADETRPVLQGARLTAYELAKDGIDVTVACDNAAGLLMHKGMIQKIVVGADRIAANGDTANKIGTYSLAVLAKEHGIPFYIAAPFSTIDQNTPDGTAIPIEQRASEEVEQIGGIRILPEGVKALNYAFDVTPARFISGIITEQGVLRQPFGEAIAALRR